MRGRVKLGTCGKETFAKSALKRAHEWWESLQAYGDVKGENARGFNSDLRELKSRGVEKEKDFFFTKVSSDLFEM